MFYYKSTVEILQFSYALCLICSFIKSVGMNNLVNLFDGKHVVLLFEVNSFLLILIVISESDCSTTISLDKFTQARG